MVLFRRSTGVPFEDPLKQIPRILTKLYSIWVSTTYPFLSVGRKLSIHYTVTLHRLTAHRVKLGNDVRIKKDSTVYMIPLDDAIGEPKIVIDDNCIIASNCQIGAKNLIHIERDVILSSSVLIMDHLHEYQDTSLPIVAQGATKGGRVRIGQGSWIGHSAVIVCDEGELVLGRNCIVGANAVVTKSYPAYSVIAGNPARVVKHFDPEKGAWVLGGSADRPQLLMMTKSS